MPRSLPTVSGGSGPRFLRHTGTAAFLSGSGEDGLVVEPDLRLADAGDASILVARRILHTSVPESAVARLAAVGVQAVLAPGFEEQLYTLCIAHGVLPLALDEALLEELASWIVSNPGLEMTVDLEKEVIERADLEPVSFSADERMRNKLLLGLTDLDEVLRQMDAVLDFRSADRRRRPWLYSRD